jgi:hypothetical protein
MKQEFKLLKTIIRDYTPADYSYEPATGSRDAKREDYDLVEVIPVSDPNAATMSQKVVQYQAVMQLAAQNPGIYDLPELNRQMLEVLGVKNINKLIPNKDEAKPVDPVSENMNMLNAKPVKAFIYQDHAAHIATHMSFKNDPMIAQVIGQGPKAAQITAALEAHLAEHLAFQYRYQLEQQLGAPLPKPDETLPEDIEVDVSRLVAKAGEQLLAKNQADIQQQQIAQQQQDPLIQMQQQELAIKQQESQVKSQKTMADIEIDKARLELEKARLDADTQIKLNELMSKVELEGAKIEADLTKSESNEKLKATQMMVDREKTQMEDLAKGVQMGMQNAQKQQEIGLKQKPTKGE